MPCKALFTLIAALAALTLAACSVPDEWEAEEKAETSADGPPELSDFNIEQREDGLFYKEGAETPYTGTHTAIDLFKKREEDRPGFTVKTPYTDGKIDGTVKTYYPGGTLQEERIFENGDAVFSTIYFSDGPIKLTNELSADNISHGEYRRYYRDGSLHDTAFIKNGSWHGEKKEFDKDGELIAHYLFDEGTIVKVYHESDQARESRLQNYGEIPEEKFVDIEDDTTASDQDSPTEENQQRE